MNETIQSGSKTLKFYDIVAVAASAGGLSALIILLEEFPKNFPFSILIVQHLDRRYKSRMAEILQRKSKLIVKEAEQGELMQTSTVYIAPPDHHLLVNSDRTICLTQTELVHFVRPSADLLFESVAASFKSRAIATVLTGSGYDGSMGVKAIKKMGGFVLAQDEASSEYFSMPSASINTGCVDQVLPLKSIGSAIQELVATGELQLEV